MNCNCHFRPKNSFKSLENVLTVTLGQLFSYSFIFTAIIIKLKSFSALIAKLLQPLNFLALSNDQNPAKPRHRPFEQSLFLFLKMRENGASVGMSLFFFQKHRVEDIKQTDSREMGWKMHFGLRGSRVPSKAKGPTRKRWHYRPDRSPVFLCEDRN